MDLGKFMATISHWYGRLGNNIQQISNAIYFCKKNNINFYSPNHELVQDFALRLGQDKDFTNRFFFYDGPYKDFDTDIIEMNSARREICLKYIVPNFKFYIKESFDEDMLVIHLRGGDVYSTFPPNTYVPNPLSFYEKIIEKYSDVLVVTEDYNNPVVKELSKKSKVLLQSTTLENDFATLLRARHLAISGVGTFAIAAALCSVNITKLYCTDIYLTEHLNPDMLKYSNIEINTTKLKNYIKIGDWRNTDEQNKIILGYKC
jgi:hypothetical protein